MDSNWKPVKNVYGGKGTLYGSIGRDGRLVIPQTIATSRGLMPGEFLALFTRTTADGVQIGLQPVKDELVNSVKISCTGRPAAYREGQYSQKGRRVNLTASLQAVLRTLSWSVAKRFRVPIEWSEEDGMLVITLGQPASVEDDLLEVR